jgi:hypothetical protein
VEVEEGVEERAGRRLDRDRAEQTEDAEHGDQ